MIVRGPLKTSAIKQVATRTNGDRIILSAVKGWPGVLVGDSVRRTGLLHSSIELQTTTVKVPKRNLFETPTSKPREFGPGSSSDTNHQMTASPQKSHGPRLAKYPGREWTGKPDL